MAVVFKPRSGAEVKKELAFAATPIKVDQVADLALLKIQAPPKDLSYLPLGEITMVEVGQDVHAIGHPEGEVWTYTTGIVSQIRPGYQWVGLDGLLHQSKVIQTQTALNPGNSGGPLLNDRRGRGVKLRRGG
jgi:S1-C subfamily serine protease